MSRGLLSLIGVGHHPSEGSEDVKTHRSILLFTTKNDRTLYLKAGRATAVYIVNASCRPHNIPLLRFQSQKIRHRLHIAKRERLLHFNPNGHTMSAQFAGQRPAAKQPAGGRGPLSADFLSVSGTLSTLLACTTIGLITWKGSALSAVLTAANMRRVLMAVTSFSYGLVLARFDLARARRLKLMIAFSVLLRMIAMPVLSHLVATAAYAVLAMQGGPVGATAATASSVAAAIPRKSTALESATLSSVFLLSATPPCFSPSLAQLSPHVHTTLLAILVTLTIIFFPILPAISHAASAWAHRNAMLNVAAVLPAVAAPPGPGLLAMVTTAPFLGGVMLSRALPARWAAASALLALPTAWSASLVLTLGIIAHAIMHATRTSVAISLGSAALCAGVAIAMILLARLLAASLLLKGRARRTLILYLCTPGATVATGVTPSGYAAFPYATAVMLATLFAAIMARMWSHIVIRSSDDII